MTRLLPLVLMLAGCPDPSPQWTVVFDDLDRAVLSATGRASDDVYLVGGSLGSGADALALHYDGDHWSELDAGVGDVTLWWAWADPGGPDVWMVGERGTVVRWDGVSFQQLESGTTTTLFGVWGASSDDVWIVGGDPIGSDADDVVLRWNGRELSRDASVPARGAALFKVWGASADRVFVSGQGGTLLHHGSESWEDRSEERGTVSSLLTIHGCSDRELYAVGGQDVLIYDGTRWSPHPDVEVLGAASGVFCAPESVLIVGSAGMKLRLDRESGQWLDEQSRPPFDTDFHGAYIDPQGNMWAVGGNYLLPAGATRRIGVVGFYGARSPSTSL